MKINIVVEGNYWFNPTKIYNEGVGGAEYILMFLAEALAKEHDVTIYNDCKIEANFNHVIYRQLSRFDPDEHCDVLMPWRVSYHKNVNADKFVFFSTDQYTDTNWLPMLSKLDKFFCISDFHKEHIQNRYPIDPAKLITITPAVNISDYLEPMEKQPYKMIFCSVPDRGLHELLSVWPVIKRRLPEAELVVTSDYTLWGANNPGNAKYHSMAQQSGIQFLGKIPREELIMHQLTSEVQAYPCSYDECFCISAAECMAAGAIPVINGSGCIPSTVRDGGIVIAESALTTEGIDRFVEELCGLFDDRKRMEEIRARGHRLATQEYNFDAMAARFIGSL